ncbi:putative aquaporin [Aspergillus steynii IBT 23096]|uniref:Putative aquaporin n=1 Tax=Aspergillus steynii IBT 23096 TaxID=1392250 RepID=A0A2I2GLA1_9EURO|nr:putative aquaporin [Aspergillus steynii IBT 23096]PLB53653.1 putative aquaporin [Aspergillus steynii IBT 23096]
MSGEQDLGDSRPPGAEDLPPIDEEPGYFQSRPYKEQPSTRSEQQQPAAAGSVKQPARHISAASDRTSQRAFYEQTSATFPESEIQDGRPLAGSQEGNPNDVYVHPEYREMNPDYMKNHEAPIWGLAKPLPRVVRPGMRRDPTRDDTMAYQTETKGESEPIPEMKMTSSRNNDQKEGPTTPATPATPAQRISSRGTYPGSTQNDTPVEQGIMSPDSSDRVSRPVESELVGQWDQPQPDDHEHVNTWALVRHWLREPLAEYLGTTVTMLIGLCATLAIGTGGSQAGDRLALYWAWGLAVMVGIYISGGVSGGHLNPAISIALWVFRGFPGRLCSYYVIAQILGALTAGGLAYCIYRDSILALAPTTPMGATGIGFYTEPLSYVRNVTAFFNEFVSAAILICTIFAMGDGGNAPPGAGMHSFIIGLLILVLCVGFGFNTGGVFNPARDLGPRLVALMAGYGGSTFTERDGWWFWGAWLATTTGALAGAAVYDVFVFIGGESPVNYPPARRKRAFLKRALKWRKRLGLRRKRIPQLEEGLKDLEA